MSKKQKALSFIFIGILSIILSFVGAKLAYIAPSISGIEVWHSFFSIFSGVAGIGALLNGMLTIEQI